MSIRRHSTGIVLALLLMVLGLTFRLGFGIGLAASPGDGERPAGVLQAVLVLCSATTATEADGSGNGEVPYCPGCLVNLGACAAPAEAGAVISLASAIPGSGWTAYGGSRIADAGLQSWQGARGPPAPLSAAA